ncbi:helix-turn-helix domain-containing protein [Curtobacterium sp. MCPF17_050]|uniref:helix-turn-helix domain-containing protein n=1 Tax=Curtobacterium sp. MCPF17_050 TaxID=2175664 RepID=UPI000D936DDC|nr:helix-turn-helix domain-containing protein [Curtobacterium sp. MCPF17_050]WIB16296.1 helix-turn-helix domain-containing protein [Curtobacterium sp. MCPF17_050]
MDELSTALRAIIREEVARQLAELGLAEASAAAGAPAPPHLLTLAEAADYLGVKTKTLYEWRRLRKGPPATLVGRLVKYRAVDLDAWLAESRA